MYVCIGKHIVYIGFRTVCDFRHHLGSCSVSWVDKGRLRYCVIICYRLEEFTICNSFALTREVKMGVYVYLCIYDICNHVHIHIYINIHIKVSCINAMAHFFKFSECYVNLRCHFRILVPWVFIFWVYLHLKYKYTQKGVMH